MHEPGHCSRTETFETALCLGAPVPRSCSPDMAACSREALQQLLATKQEAVKLAQIEALLAGELGPLRSLGSDSKGCSTLGLG